MSRFLTQSSEETEELAAALATRMPIRGVVLLIGGLGAGKTTFARGVIATLRAAPPEEVTSPTYTIVHEYGSPVRVYHIDLYRLETVEEVLALGWDDLMDSNALLLVEWGERFPSLFSQDPPAISFEPVADDQRRIDVRGIDTSDLTLFRTQ